MGGLELDICSWGQPSSSYATEQESGCDIVSKVTDYN